MSPHESKGAAGCGAALPAALLLLLGLVAMALYQPAPGTLPSLAAFLGRFHVLLLHFPIGFLVLALILFLGQMPTFSRWLPAASPAVVVWVVALGAVSAWLAAACGWLLAFSDGYDAAAVGRHFYAGVACAGVALVSWLLARAWAAQTDCPLRQRGTLALLALTNLLVILAGHLGGSLTHGEHYLFEKAPAPIRSLAGLPAAPAAGTPEKPGEDQPVFAAVIQPFLQQYCLECHNEKKAKGDLRLDLFAETLHALEPGKPGESTLIKRLRLPLDDEDHMPPKGKPQPAEHHIAVLEWWIATGAKEKATLRDLNPPPAIRRALGLP